MGVAHIQRKYGQKRDWWLARYQQSLIPWLVCFVFGLALCAYQCEPGRLMPDWTSPWLLASWLAVFSGIAVLSSKRHIWLTLMCLVMILLGGGYYRFQHLVAGPQDVSLFAHGATSRVIGEWYTQSENPKNALLVVQSVNAQPAKGRLQVKLSRRKLPFPLPGALVAIEGRLSKPDVTTIPGAFQEWRYLASRRVTAVLHHPSRLDILETTPVSLEGQLHQYLFHIRHRIAQTFSRALPSPLAEIQGGIVLGDQAIPVGRDTRLAFANTGLIHLLAASGMNVGIVAGVLFLLARLLRLPPRLQIMLGMAGALAYALLSGLSPSVLRATAMLEIALALKLLDKTLSHLLVLLLAVVSLLLYNVELVTSVGFQLSVITTFGIIAMVSPLQKRLGYYLGQGMAATLVLPFVAQLWATPLLITYFNAFPLLGILLNMLAVPLVVALTGIGFFCALLGLLSQPLAIILAKISWPILWILNWLVTVVSAWQWAQWQLPSLSPFALIASYGILLAISYALAFPSAIRLSSLSKTLLKPKIAISIVLLLLSVTLYFTNTQRTLLTIHVLPLSKTMTAFIVQDGGENTLLLPDSITPWYSQKVADYARNRQLVRFASLVWIPTVMPSRNESTRTAVVERLKHNILIANVSNIRSFHPKPMAWKLTENPFQPNALKQAGFQAVVQPLWQLSAHHFCMASGYKDLQQPFAIKPLKQQCPIQLLQERQSRYKLSSAWYPGDIPSNRYFKFVYRHNRWQIEY